MFKNIQWYWLGWYQVDIKCFCCVNGEDILLKTLLISTPTENRDWDIGDLWAMHRTGSPLRSLLTFLSFKKPLALIRHFKIYPAGERSSSNAFLSPQWGGIMIYNVERTAIENNTKPQQIAVDMKPVMNIFLSQLKLLLGWKPVVSMQVMLHNSTSTTRDYSRMGILR